MKFLSRQPYFDLLSVHRMEQSRDYLKNNHPFGAQGVSVDAGCGKQVCCTLYDGIICSNMGLRPLTQRV